MTRIINIICLIVGITLGAGGALLFGSRHQPRLAQAQTLESPADIKYKSVEMEHHFQNRLDSLQQSNAALKDKAGSVQKALQQARQNNKELAALVDTLVAHSQKTDTAARLAACDSIGTAVRQLAATSDEKDSICDMVIGTFRAEVSNRDSVIGIQQESYSTLKLSFDQSLAQQELLLSQTHLYETQLKKMRIKNKLLSAGLCVVAGIAVYSFLKQ